MTYLQFLWRYKTNQMQAANLRSLFHYEPKSAMWTFCLKASNYKLGQNDEEKIFACIRWKKWIKRFDFYFKLMMLPAGHGRICEALMWSIFLTVSSHHSVSADVHCNDIIPSGAPNIFLNVQSETFNRGGHISKLNLWCILCTQRCFNFWKQNWFLSLSIKV